MFESLTSSLENIFAKIKGTGKLNEEQIKLSMREIRIALLDADVSLLVAKDLVQKISEKALGQEVIRSITPEQMITKIIYDELVTILSKSHVDGSESVEENRELNFNAPSPVNFMMVGLQGSGKTTSTAKLAARLAKEGKRVMVVSLDIYRPAAQLQLEILAKQANVMSLPILPEQNVIDITKRALKESKRLSCEVVIYDTAGRLHIDQDMLQELQEIKSLVNPTETLLVVDSMTGQEAVNIAQKFDEKIDLSGVVLTRIDGDARGGAALSIKYITGKPIKFTTNGEKLSAIDPFHPERIASRILGKGDIISLVEKAAEVVDKERAEKSFRKGKFNLNDYLQQLRTIKKLGGIGSMLKFLPSGLNLPTNGTPLKENIPIRQEAIILSMTTKERTSPEIINASRKRRIALGAGTSVQEVNKLLKQFQHIQDLLKKAKKLEASKKLNSFSFKRLFS